MILRTKSGLKTSTVCEIKPPRGTDEPTINLTKIDKPVLIIQGSNDEMMDSTSSLELFRQIPNSILTYYPDSAHGSYYQYPDLFVEQANIFLDNFE